MLQNGDLVKISTRGLTKTARIVLAAANEKSLFVEWQTTDDGMIGAYAGGMPLLMDDGGVYRDLIDGLPVTVELISAEG